MFVEYACEIESDEGLTDLHNSVPEVLWDTHNCSCLDCRNMFRCFGRGYWNMDPSLDKK